MTAIRRHLIQEENPLRTLCGRSVEESNSTPKTARVSTIDVKKFLVKPCKDCLNMLIDEHGGKIYGKKYNVDDLKKKL